MNACKPVIGATAMVYGFDMAENLTKLAQYVRHAELLLYWTPSENNFPTTVELQHLNELQQKLNLSLSIHLPPTLNLVLAEKAERNESVQLLINLIQNMERLHPTGYVLHMGPSLPSLWAKPENYLHADTTINLDYWYKAGFNILETLQIATNLGRRLLLENLDFSPLLLRPFLEKEMAGLCLDIGHLWLGCEPIANTLYPLQEYIGEIHLHGVANNEEHISLQKADETKLAELNETLIKSGYSNIINLEIFDPKDFQESLAVLKTIV